MSELSITSEGPRRTRRIAVALAGLLRAGDVIALEGALGSGKTCFVRGLAEGLGIDPAEVSSPTFVICQEYGLERPVPLVHVDVYRVSGPDDLETVGLEEVIEQGHAVVAIEWASRIAPALPAERITVEFAHEGPSRREITVTGPDKLVTALVGACETEGSARDGSAVCSICGEPIDPDGPDAPFCSPRCRGADLGRWLGGRYRISRPAWSEDDEDR